MAFSYSIKYEGRATVGSLRMVVGTWDADSVTSGTIVTGLNRILHSGVTNNTGNRADSTVDDTTTAGSIAIDGVTSGDSGTFIAIGK